MQNPETASILCGELTTSLPQLGPFLDPADLSTTVPIWDAETGTFKPKLDYRRAEEHRLNRQALFRFELRTDITRFYPSIYTHSIAWAVEGKDTAKSRPNDLGLLGNRIDKALRNCQEAQTNGIPIGPMSSQLVAELLLGRVDQRLDAQLRDGPTKLYEGSRSIDDYHVYTWDQETAFRAKNELYQGLAEFNLELNASKTSVSGLPSQPVPSWLLRIDAMPLEDPDSQREKDHILRLYSLARELADQNPAHSVMGRFVSRLRERVTSHRENAERIQDLCFKAMALDPRAISRVVGLLKEMKDDDIGLDEGKLRYLLEAMVFRNRGAGNTYEICWTLWLNLLYEGSISDSCLRMLEGIQDPFVACLVLRHSELGLVARKPEVSAWQTIIDKDPEGLRGTN